jgi:small subunit ribosomal protein S6
MTAQAPTYDLVLLLDPEAEQRARPLADARAAIEAQGELLRHDEWGSRALAYAIRRRSAAEYHLLQFHSGNPELLRTLDRSLRLADEVLRFRIVKLRPGTPEPPELPAAVPTPSRRTAPEPPDAPAPAPAAAPAEPAGAAEPVGVAEPAREGAEEPGAGEG